MEVSSMLSPIELARCFFDTFDKSSVALFRRYLAKNPAITKWMIAADFSLHEPSRPLDCMAFTIVPYDAEFHEIGSDVAAALPKDLKKSRDLSPGGAAWLRDTRRLHVVITMKKERLIFYNGTGSDARLVAREHIGKTIEV